MKGLRAIPAPLQLAFLVSFAEIIAYAVFYATVDQPWGAPRFELTMRGLTLATEVCALAGMIELSRRLTGIAAAGATVALVGYALELAADVGWTFAMFNTKLWEHEWIFTANQWAWWIGSTVLLVGIAIAAWEQIAVAIVTLVIGLLIYPPPILGKLLYSWMPDGKTGIVMQYAMMAARLALMVLAVSTFARRDHVTDRRLAAQGLRGCASALWMRIIAACGVVLITAMAAGGARRGEGAVEFLKLATMAGAAINIAALVWFATGALRAAASRVAELNRYMLVLAGGASLWGAGVVLGQLPQLYHMLYKPDDVLGRGSHETVEALKLAMPLVVMLGVAILALVIGSFAALRRAEELRVQAQTRGIIFVALLLFSLGIQVWVLPKSESLGSFAFTSLLAAFAALVGTIVIAKLCMLAADELEKEPGLPAATLISDGT